MTATHLDRDGRPLRPVQRVEVRVRGLVLSGPVQRLHRLGDVPAVELEPDGWRTGTITVPAHCVRVAEAACHDEAGVWMCDEAGCRCLPGYRSEP